MAKFPVFFRELENVVDRPERCKGAKKTDVLFKSPRYWFDLMKDNIVHVRRLLDVLVANDLVRSKIQGAEDPKDVMQTCMRRIYALLAISHGLWSEPALLCPILDHLLEELASCLTGHIDPKFETTRLQRMMRALQNSQPEEVEAFTSVPKQKDDVAKLEREHKARVYFEEIARFARGALMMGVAVTSPKVGADNLAAKEVWFNQLLHYSSRCGHRSCQEQLKVVKKAEAKTQKYSLSVAAEDTRIGYPEER